MELGENGYFGHEGFAVLISKHARIGNHFSIRPQVLIGQTPESPHAPILGDRVSVGAGAKIIGAVKIGNNVWVGTNAVVLADVPDNCTVVGIPAKIVRKYLFNLDMGYMDTLEKGVLGDDLKKEFSSQGHSLSEASELVSSEARKSQRRSFHEYKIMDGEKSYLLREKKDGLEVSQKP